MKMKPDKNSPKQEKEKTEIKVNGRKNGKEENKRENYLNESGTICLFLVSTVLKTQSCN